MEVCSIGVREKILKCKSNIMVNIPILQQDSYPDGKIYLHLNRGENKTMVII